MSVVLNAMLEASTCSVCYTSVVLGSTEVSMLFSVFLLYLDYSCIPSIGWRDGVSLGCHWQGHARHAYPGYKVSY